MIWAGSVHDLLLSLWVQSHVQRIDERSVCGLAEQIVTVSDKPPPISNLVYHIQSTPTWQTNAIRVHVPVQAGHYMFVYGTVRTLSTDTDTED